MNYDCLIVDDEEALSESTCEYFNLFDVKTAWVPDSVSCMTFFEDNSVDVILLDINLKNESGFTLCQEVRKRTKAPILFISARTSDDDVLLALNVGGDDYISKPYSLQVLLAKVKTVLKRYRGEEGLGEIPKSELNEDQPFVLDHAKYTVRKNDVSIPLKAMEYKLLSCLIENKGRVVPKEELFLKVWGEAITGLGTLNVHVRHLREKLEDDPNNPVYITTVWGIGYMFDAGPSISEGIPLS